MIKKEDLIKIVKHATRRASGKRDRRIIHPRREWLLGLFIGLLAFVVGSIYTGNLFYQTYTEDIDTYTASEEIATYNYRRVENALLIYRKREAAFKALGGRLTFPPEEASPLAPEDEEVVAEETEEGVE